MGPLMGRQRIYAVLTRLVEAQVAVLVANGDENRPAVAWLAPPRDHPENRIVRATQYCTIGQLLTFLWHTTLISGAKSSGSVVNIHSFHSLMFHVV